MNLALNNATNVIDYYGQRGECKSGCRRRWSRSAYAANSSPVQGPYKRLKDYAFPGKIQFSACNNTKQAMEKKRTTRSTFHLKPSSCPQGS